MHASSSSASAGSAWATDPFLVGVVSPLTGPMALVGANGFAAVQWWAHTINAAGGIKGRLIELDICDDQGSPESAVTCVRRQIARGIPIILDNSVSGTNDGLISGTTFAIQVQGVAGQTAVNLTNRGTMVSPRRKNAIVASR